MRESKHIVIRNPELVKALKAFTPLFANDEDRRVLSRIASHDKVLRTVDNKVLRSGKNLTKKMVGILKDEEKLIELVINRNMDF